MKRLRKFLVVAIVAAWLFGGIAGLASALTVYNTDFDYHIFNGDSAYSVYTVADEPANFSDVTLFCGLDAYDASTNTTPCFLRGNATSASIVNALGATLVVGRIGNAIELTGTSATASALTSPTIDVAISETYTSSISFAVWLKILDRTDLRSIMQLKTANGVVKIYWPAGSEFSIGYTDVAGNWWSIPVQSQIDDGNWHFIVVNFIMDGVRNTTRIQVYIDASVALDVEKIGVPVNDFTVFELFQNNNVGRVVYDEARVKIDGVFTQDEIKLLYLAGRKKLSEPANLTITNVAYDGSRFDITVNATLPAGAQYLYIPQIAITGDTVVQNWSTGHRMINVSGKTWTTFTIPATPGSALTGLNMLAIETDNGVYAYGSGSYTLTNPSTALYYENTVQPTNTISAGRVTTLGWSGAGTLTLLKPSTLTLTAGDGQVKFDKYTLEDTKLDVLSLINPLKITATLLPVTEYKITKDLNPVVSKINSNEDGVLSFTIDSTGTWEIFKAALGASIAMDYIMKVLLTTIIVAIFAMLVVERTPTKLDDRITKAMITMIALVVVIALVRVIVLTR